MGTWREMPGTPGAAAVTLGAERDPRVGRLLDRLIADLHPVAPYWSPQRRFAIWIVTQVGVLALVLVDGTRSDLALRLRPWPFVVELHVPTIVALASGLFALRSGVPGQEPSRRVVFVLVGAVVSGLGLAGMLVPHAPLGWSLLPGFSCAWETLLIAMLPWSALAVVATRGAALDPGIAGLLAGMGPLAAAAAAMLLRCPVDEGMHLLIWHACPVLLGLLAAVGIGLRVVGGWARRPL